MYAFLSMYVVYSEIVIFRFLFLFSEVLTIKNKSNCHDHSTRKVTKVFYSTFLHFRTL